MIALSRISNAAIAVWIGVETVLEYCPIAIGGGVKPVRKMFPLIWIVILTG